MKSKIIASLIIILTGCSQVDNGEIGIKKTFGKVDNHVLSPDIYFYTPFITKVVKLNTKIQTTEEESNASTKDLQSIVTNLVLNYHLDTKDPISHYIRLGDNQQYVEESIIKPAMSEVFKSVVAQFVAEDLIIQREKVSQMMETELVKKIKQYDLTVDSISIKNFKFSNGFSQAIEAKQIAEQHALKAKNDLQRIQVEAQQKIIEAEAQAKSMTLQRSILTPELIQLKQLEMQKMMIERWDGKMPQYMTGNTNPILMLNK